MTIYRTPYGSATPGYKQPGTGTGKSPLSKDTYDPTAPYGVTSLKGTPYGYVGQSGSGGPGYALPRPPDGPITTPTYESGIGPGGTNLTKDQYSGLNPSLAALYRRQDAMRSGGGNSAVAAPGASPMSTPSPASKPPQPYSGYTGTMGVTSDNQGNYTPTPNPFQPASAESNITRNAQGTPIGYSNVQYGNNPTASNAGVMWGGPIPPTSGTQTPAMPKGGIDLNDAMQPGQPFTPPSGGTVPPSSPPGGGSMIPVTWGGPTTSSPSSPAPPSTMPPGGIDLNDAVQPGQWPAPTGSTQPFGAINPVQPSTPLQLQGSLSGGPSFANYGTSITPGDLFTPSQTAHSVSQGVGQLLEHADPFYAQKAFDRPGLSRSRGTMSAATPGMAEATQGARTAMQQIPMQDALKNAQFRLQGQQAQGQEGLALANILRRLQQTQDFERTQSLSPMLSALLSGM